MTDKVQKIREEVEMIVNRRLNLLNGDYFDLNKEADGFTNEIMDIIDSMQLEEIPPKFPLISQKKCMYAKENYTDKDRKILCDGCEEECEYAQKKEPVNKDFELALAEMIDKAQKCVVEPWVVAAQWKDELIKLAKSGEPVSDECIYNRTLEERQRSCKFCSAACQVRIKEPVSEDLEEEAAIYIERFLDGDLGFNPKLLHSNAKLSDVYNELNMIFKAGAQWKEKQMMAKAVDATVHIEAGNYPYIPQIELYDYDKDVPLAKEGDKYKVVLIKEG